MSYFNRTGDTLEEQPDQRPPAGSRLADLGDRIARMFTTVERGRVQRRELPEGDAVAPEYEQEYEYEDVDQDEDVDEDGLPGPLDEEPFTPRFAVGPFGYSRAAVDEYLVEVERELGELRRARPPAPPSINEEIERLGEQTASILVVAHDQAHATTRRAQEQADRCLADAAANAVAMTEQAKQQLRALDSETDAVWHERRRLIEDVRTTAAAMLALADDAIDRFPEEGKPVTTESPQVPEG